MKYTIDDFEHTNNKTQHEFNCETVADRCVIIDTLIQHGLITQKEFDTRTAIILSILDNYFAEFKNYKQRSKI